MATINLEPTADGSTSSPTVTYVGGSANFSNLKSPDDDATTHVNLTDNPATQSWWIDKLPAAAAINANPTVRGRCRKNTSGFSASWQQGVRIGGSTTLDGFVEPGDLTWFTDTSPGLARPGGGSWTPADFPGGTSGTEVQAGPTGGNTGVNHNWSTIYTTVDYTPAAGGFAENIAMWAAALIPLASHGLSLAEIGAFFERLDRRGLHVFKLRPSGVCAREEREAIRWAHLVRPRFAI